MKKFKIVFLIILLFIAIGFLFVTCKYQSEKKNNETFLATITEINKSEFTVEGRETNNINFRGAFSICINPETKLEKGQKKIDISDFSIGENISITFTGNIQETYPPRIANIKKIRLIQQKKEE